MRDVLERETPKYRKHKESNVSKGNRKSKHKHTYVPAIFHYLYVGPLGNKHDNYAVGQYCSLCGKIGKYQKAFEKTPDGFYRRPSDEEILEKNKDLEIFEVENFFQKYININNN